MLFRSVVPLALLVCSSTAAPIEKRQRQTDHQIVAGVLNGITQGIKRTQTDIGVWRGDQAGANLVLDDSEYLYRDILEGTSIVSRTNPVSTWDTASMIAPGNSLNMALESMMDLLISKKRQIEKINYTPIVRSQLFKLRDAADNLTKACFSKLPAVAAVAVKPVSSMITAKIEKGIKAFAVAPQGSGSWWPVSPGNQPPPTVSGPSPYRNDPVPQGPPPQSSQPQPFPPQGPPPQAFPPQGTPPQGNNGGWGQPQPPKPGFSAPPPQNGGWKR